MFSNTKTKCSRTPSVLPILSLISTSIWNKICSLCMSWPRVGRLRRRWTTSCTLWAIPTMMGRIILLGFVRDWGGSRTTSRIKRMSTRTRLLSSCLRSLRRLSPSLMTVSIWRVWRVDKGIGIEGPVSLRNNKRELRLLRRLCRVRYPRFMYKGRVSMIRLSRLCICYPIRSVVVRMIGPLRKINSWTSSRRYLRERKDNSRPQTNKSATKWPASSQPSNSPLRPKLYWWKTTTKN